MWGYGAGFQVYNLGLAWEQVAVLESGLGMALVKELPMMNIKGIPMLARFYIGFLAALVLSKHFSLL